MERAEGLLLSVVLVTGSWERLPARTFTQQVASNDLGWSHRWPFLDLFAALGHPLNGMRTRARILTTPPLQLEPFSEVGFRDNIADLKKRPAFESMVAWQSFCTPCRYVSVRVLKGCLFLVLFKRRKLQDPDHLKEFLSLFQHARHCLSATLSACPRLVPEAMHFVSHAWRQGFCLEGPGYLCFGLRNFRYDFATFLEALANWDEQKGSNAVVEIILCVCLLPGFHLHPVVGRGTDQFTYFWVDAFAGLSKCLFVGQHADK